MNTGRVLARVDYAVVGGGIVALAVARSLAQRAERNTTVAMLERNSAAASEQTGHNSGVVHSGLFYSLGPHNSSVPSP
jgi:L-2-hydroxyglutarate oxidase